MKQLKYVAIIAALLMLFTSLSAKADEVANSEQTDLSVFEWSETSGTAYVGQSFMAPVFTASYEDMTVDNKFIAYSSDNISVAAVSAEGVITLGGSTGSATISATLKDPYTFEGKKNVTATYVLTVTSETGAVAVPTFSPEDDCTYDGDIKVAITAANDCKVVYNWGTWTQENPSAAYTIEQLKDRSLSATNTAIAGISNRTDNIFLSAAAVRTVNGVQTFSSVVTHYYSYQEAHATAEGVITFEPVTDGAIETGDLVTVTAPEGTTLYTKWSSESNYTASKLKVDANKRLGNVNQTSSSKTGTRYLYAMFVTEDGKQSEVFKAQYTVVASSKPAVTLYCEAVKVDAGSKVQLNVTAKDADGNTVSGLDYKYISNNTYLISVDESGLVSGLHSGNTSITVSFAGNASYQSARVLVNVGVTSTATASAKGTVFTNIADVRHVGQTTYQNDKPEWILQFPEDNPATVVAKFVNNDPDWNNGKEGAGNIFIVDRTGRGLMIPYTTNYYNDEFISNLHPGDKFTGTIIGKYKQRTSMIPEFTEIKASAKYNNVSYKTSATVDRSGEGTADVDPVVPVTSVHDVHTLAYTNSSNDKVIKDGSITYSSYGIYLNTVVELPGYIGKNGAEHYLLQNENTLTTDVDNRIYFNSSQLDIDLDSYVGTSGTFRGILIKRNDAEPKLVVLSYDFYTVETIYIDENDKPGRISELVENGALDHDAEVFLHRTNWTKDTWGTICLPFDMSFAKLKSVLNLKEFSLAQAATDGSQEGSVSGNGYLQFRSSKSDETTTSTDANKSLKAGVPYIIKVTPNDGVSLSNIPGSASVSNVDTKTPAQLKQENSNYFVSIGKKNIHNYGYNRSTHFVEAYNNNEVVNGKFYFLGNYGKFAETTELIDGVETTINVADPNQKVQYVSTAAGNYLKYLPATSTLKFNGLRAYFYFPNWNKEKNAEWIANTAASTSAGAKVNPIGIVIDDDFVTSVDGLDFVPSQSSHVRVYNLNGQLVGSSLNGLSKGIYIVNGKKYMVK